MKKRGAGGQERIRRGEITNVAAEKHISVTLPSTLISNKSTKENNLRERQDSIQMVQTEGGDQEGIEYNNL